MVRQSKILVALESLFARKSAVNPVNSDIVAKKNNF